MAKYESKSLRNLAVAGHGGTGKTSLCESFLFVSGKSERLGRVDDATSCMDFEPEEQKKGYPLARRQILSSGKNIKLTLLTHREILILPSIQNAQ